MHAIVEDLALILPVIAVFCVLSVLLVNIYLKIRRLIPVGVNCWFCNKWTKVHYDLRNCFECPACLQYNGFNSEGDYNKSIPAQYEDLLNHDVTYHQQSGRASSTATNGLCLSCNNNLRLKVFQLANFIPLNENNYDAEIEHFEQQLDKSYKLCLPCEIVVKTTLRKQNALLGLKLPNLRIKGIRLLDFNSYSKNKRTFLIKAIGFALVTIAFCNIAYILSRFDYSNDSLRKVMPQTLYPYVLKLKEFCINIQEGTIQYFNGAFSNDQVYVPFGVRKDIDFEYNTKLLCCLGASLQLILLFLSEGGRTKKFIQIVAWGLLIWFSWWNYPVLNFNYNNYAQIITNIVIITSVCFTWSFKIKPKKLKRKSSLKMKHSKTIVKEEPLYDANDIKKIGSKNRPHDHFTEFSKPDFISNSKFPKSDLSYQNYESPLYAYNTNNVMEKSLHLQDDLVSNLTKLNLGRSRKLTNSNYENPFLKIRTPSYKRNNSCLSWGSNSNLRSKEMLLPSAPSSIILKVQFSTRNSKF